jgi:hypothetical protein
MIARCACGRIEITTVGAPLMSVACYCGDCQAGSRQIAVLPNARPIADPDGGTPFVLYRKDRVDLTTAGHLLKDLRLNEGSPTKRVVASCCNTGMFLNFEKGHWLSMYRGRFQGDMPRIEMRIQTQSAPNPSEIPADVHCYKSFPFKFIGKLWAARLAMLIGL